MVSNSNTWKLIDGLKIPLPMTDPWDKRYNYLYGPIRQGTVHLPQTTICRTNAVGTPR